MLQHICSCGRIAEVRRRKNGQKLAYSHCTHCKGSNTSLEKSKEILANAREDIGVKGEFFKNSTQSAAPVAVKGSKNFEPDIEDLPENLELDIKKDENNLETETGDNPSKIGKFFKCLLGVGAVFGLGALGYNVVKSNKG